MTTTDRQIAFLPAIRKIRACPIYFDGVKFSTTQKTCAQKFDTVALLQAAITQAYKNGTVSADEINAYCSVRAPRVPTDSESANALAGSSCYVHRTNR